MASAIRTSEYGRTTRHTWTLTTADGTGDAISIPGAADRTVQFLGTFGSATVLMEGSLVDDPSADDTDWFTLTDGQGTAISFTAKGGEFVAENTLWLRPRLSVAGSGAAITVRLLSKSTMR